MTVIQVPSSFVRGNIRNPDVYRISSCNDGNYGKQHTAVRIKPLKNLTVEEFAESIDNPNYAFVTINFGIDEII